MTALGAVIEDLVKANNAVDIYEEYFAGKVSTHDSFCDLYHTLSWDSLLVAAQSGLSNPRLSILAHLHWGTLVTE